MKVFNFCILVLIVGVQFVSAQNSNKVLEPKREHSPDYFSPIERYRYNWGLSGITSGEDHYTQLHFSQSIVGRHLITVKEVVGSRVLINQKDELDYWEWTGGILLNAQVHFRYFGLWAEGGPVLRSHHFGFKNSSFFIQASGGLHFPLNDRSLFLFGYQFREVKAGSSHFGVFGFSIGY